MGKGKAVRGGSRNAGRGVAEWRNGCAHILMHFWVHCKILAYIFSSVLRCYFNSACILHLYGMNRSNSIFWVWIHHTFILQPDLFGLGLEALKENQISSVYIYLCDKLENVAKIRFAIPLYSYRTHFV